MQATPRAALGFCSANRAENLCYRFNHGQKLLLQFRKIVGLVYSIWWDTHTRIDAVIAATASLACKQRREPHLAFVLLTAPKIFAINSHTGKKSCHNFARLSAWCFDWVGHPHPNRCRHRDNGIACLQATPRAALGFCSANRAENLCYQFSREQKLLPQYRKIVGLVYSIWWDTHARIDAVIATTASLASKQRREPH